MASGTGTNLQAILNRFKASPDVKVVGVVSNKPDAPALERARRADVPTRVFSRLAYANRIERDEAMASWVEERGAELIVLAGYLEILSVEFVSRFPAKIINVHPSLLPEFPGLHSIERAFEAQVKKSGVTVHVVDEGVDTGPEVEQRIVKLRRREKLRKFEERIHAAEHELLPSVVDRIASGELSLESVQRSSMAEATNWKRVRRFSFRRLRWQASSLKAPGIRGTSPTHASRESQVGDPSPGSAAVRLR